MKHFTEREFRGWFAYMDPVLLDRLDNFRASLGAPVVISPAHGAIGRRLTNSNTQHNISRWGQVRAVDVMPKVPAGDMERALRLAIKSGFSGIGLYPHWRPQWGMHLDTRRDREPGSPALWSGLRVGGVQVYRAIEEAFA